MPVAESPQAPEAPKKHEELALTIDYTDEGWWAVRVQGTGAFGQGRTRDEALADAVSALHTLTHRATLAERALFRLRALSADLRDLLPTR